MTGITNRPDNVEEENQERVQETAEQLPGADTAGSQGKPANKLTDSSVAERGRVSETGAGRGTEHKGH